jgi:hypothetical protein
MDDSSISKAVHVRSHMNKAPTPMPGLSKRAQQLLKPRPNQIVLAKKGQADKTRAIMKGGI